MDNDQLWVTSTTGYPTDFLHSLPYNIEEANLSQSLLKTQRLMGEFLQERKKENRTEDKKILEDVKNKLCKSIMLVFKNPNLDD